MEGARRTRHRRHSRRGGMSADLENKFLEKQRKERQKSLAKVGDNAREAPLVLESTGTETRQASPLRFLVDMRTESARKEAKAGRRRSRRRRHTRRRR